MTVTRPPSGFASARQAVQSHAAIAAELQTALKNSLGEAEGIAFNATLIANAIAEAQANGGQIQVQGQINYLTGAMARLLKDLGVVEHLQRHGAAAQRRALLRRKA